MDTLFTYLKKGLVATIFVMFALVATYVPQDWNKVEVAHAGAGGGGATEFTQLIRWGFEQVNNLAIKISTGLTSVLTNSLYLKEYLLDGIAWVVAKLIISQIMQELISWINSGFKGSPMFIQDLEGFLRNAADRAVGEYIDELGGPLSFLCDPFKLDIQVAIATQYYKQDRTYQPAPTCTLSNIIGNIEDYTSGTLGSFEQGGWDNWLNIIAQPSVYTPYGAYLAAQSGAEMRVLTTKGEETTKSQWTAGFLSNEICQMVSSGGTTKEECSISTPGKAIQEALSFNLDSGRQSLVAADEIDELIGALFSQLANKALGGAAGLLGLSGDTGYTYDVSGTTYLESTLDELEIQYDDAMNKDVSVPTSTDPVPSVDDADTVVDSTDSERLTCPDTYEVPPGTTIIKMGGTDNLSKIEFNQAFDGPGNRIDSRSEVGQIKAWEFDNNAYLSGKITGTGGNFGPPNYKDWSISACPGDFRDVLPPKCKRIRSLGVTLYYHASDATLGCLIPPNQPMYLNIRATDPTQVAGYAVSNVPAELLP